MSTLILYGHEESGHSYKVALALALAGIEYEFRWVDVHAPRDERRSDFRAVSRFSEIPVLVDDGVALARGRGLLPGVQELLLPDVRLFRDRVHCSYGALTGALTAVDESTCTGAHYCLSEDSSECTCSASACATGETELSSCTDASAKALLRANVAATRSVVDDCRVSAASAVTSSMTGNGGSTGGSPKCTAAGPGTCGDTPSLNHCNCGAGCYRDSPGAGSGYSCHITCTTDADCNGLYDHSTTCQPFTADTGTPAMECR